MGTISAGMRLTPYRLNTLIFSNKPAVRLILGGSNQSFANTTQAAINFATSNGSIEAYDTHNIHSLSSNPSRITPTVAGIYAVNGTILWESNASGDRRAYIGKNGTAGAPVSRRFGSSGGSLTCEVYREIECNGSTDYIELYGYQSSGGSLQAQGSGADFSTFSTVLTAVWLRPLP